MSDPCGAVGSAISPLEVMTVPSGKPYLQAIALGLLVALLLSVTAFPYMRATSDAPSYIPIAQGHWSKSPNPHAKRFVHPLLVRYITHVTGMSIDRAFRALSFAFLFLFVPLVCVLIQVEAQSRRLILALVMAPALFQLFTDYYMQDLLHALLLALYFMLLVYKPLATFPVLFALYCTRESTALLSACVIWLAWRRSQNRLAVSSLLATLAGVAASWYASTLGSPNVSGVPEGVYYLLKIPYNFIPKVLGLQLWVDTQVAYNHCAPVWTVHVLGWLPVGRIREFGFCGVDYLAPWANLTILFTTFGVLPLFVWASLPKHWRSSLRTGPIHLEVAFWYSLLCIVASVSGGATVERYVTYAWPLFWLVGPRLMATSLRPDWVEAVQIIFWNCAFTWLPHLAQWSKLSRPEGTLLMLAITIAAYVTSYGMTQRQLDPAFAAAKATGSAHFRSVRGDH